MNRLQEPNEYLWQYLQDQNTKIAKRVYEQMNRENFWLVFTNGYADNGIWNFEHNTYTHVPNYAYYYIKKVMKKAGYIYCFDIGSLI